MSGMIFDYYDEISDVSSDDSKREKSDESFMIENNSHENMSGIIIDVQEDAEIISNKQELSMGIGNPFLSLIGKVLNTIDNISTCYALVTVEKQRTKQVQAKSAAIMTMAEEKTKQTKIAEKEATKRLDLECTTRLEEKKIELKKLQMELDNQNKDRKMEHKEIMKKLNITHDMVLHLIECNQSLYEQLKYCEEKDKILFFILDNENMLITLQKEMKEVGRGYND